VVRYLLGVGLELNAMVGKGKAGLKKTTPRSGDSKPVDIKPPSSFSPLKKQTLLKLMENHLQRMISLHKMIYKLN